MKKCSKCGGEFPATSEYFNKGKNGKYEFRGECKTCQKEYRKQHYEENSDKEKAIGRAWKEANPERVRANTKEWRDANPEKANANTKAWAKLNPEKVKALGRAYREANRDKVKDWIKVWREANRDKTRKHNQQRKAKKRNLPSTFTLEQWEATVQCFSNRCAYCGKESPLAQEHFIALSKGGEYALANIIPSCQSCNSSKGTKSFSIWYPQQSFYSKKREKAMLSYLGYKNNVQQLALM